MSKDTLSTEKAVDNKLQIEKDRVQKETATDQARPRCRICTKYTDKKSSPQCGCGGGGGGSSGGSSDEKADKSEGTILATTDGQVDKTTQVEVMNTIGDSIALMPQLESTIKFNPDVISDLLSKGLLTIDNDREKGIFTIKLLCDHNLLSAEQKNELKQFFDVILNEFNEFKKGKGISDHCCTIQRDKDGTIVSLRITLPTSTLYDAFIQKLANKHLLPIQNINQKKNEKVIYPKDMNLFNPTPEKTKSIEHDKEDKTQEKRSSIRPKTPSDGLKPRGWQ